MWFLVEKCQKSYLDSEHLLQLVSRPTPVDPGTAEQITGLVRDGADLNRVHGHLLPLQSACITGNASMLKLLVKLGADVDQCDGYGRMALHYAAERSHQCVQALIRAGAYVSCRDRSGNTPLHWAAYKNQPRCVALLLDAGADIDAVDNSGDTALNWAALKGNLDVIQLLLLYNCRTDARNVSGGGAISRLIATISMGIGSNVDAECLQLLIDASAQIQLNHEVYDMVNGDDEMRLWVLPMVNNVRSLEQLCRYTIRRYLGAGRLPDRIDRLPVSRPLQIYLAIPGLLADRNDSSTNDDDLCVENLTEMSEPTTSVSTEEVDEPVVATARPYSPGL